MSYLVCKKCSGYYKLKKGEAPNDFESCECGGELKHVQSFNTHLDEKLDAINEINICSECGTENITDTKHCLSCGKSLNDIKNYETISDTSEEETLKESKNSNNLLRVIGIITGILIVLIPAFLFVNHDYSLLLLVISGFVISFIARGKNEDGALNGAFVGLIAGFLLLIFKGNLGFSYDIAFDIEIIIDEMIGILLLFVIFSFIGGIIGILTRNYLSKTNINK